jgi:hypothetical protein
MGCGVGCVKASWDRGRPARIPIQPLRIMGSVSQSGRDARGPRG